MATRSIALAFVCFLWSVRGSRVRRIGDRVEIRSVEKQADAHFVAGADHDAYVEELIGPPSPKESTASKRAIASLLLVPTLAASWQAIGTGRGPSKKDLTKKLATRRSPVLKSLRIEAAMRADDEKTATKLTRDEFRDTEEEEEVKEEQEEEKQHGTQEEEMEDEKANDENEELDEEKTENGEVANLPDAEWPPISSFDIDAETVELLAEQGITNFTPIQSQCYDLILNGKDVLARSQTGTGKTLAFSLPLIKKLAQDRRNMRPTRGRSPSMLVLVPTRELAKQVASVIEMLAKPHGFRVAAFYGGTPYEQQDRQLCDGLDVLVGTPGRIIDHLRGDTLDLSSAVNVVLDEADEMLSMGFKDDVERILDATAKRGRQTLLFSATRPSWVMNVADRYLVDLEIVDTTGEGESEAATTVEHYAVFTPTSELARSQTLADVITVYGSLHSRTIVFVNKKKECDELCTAPAMIPLAAQPLHGDIPQLQRERTLKQFRDGSFPVLVATDVAARGIDISDVDLIVNYRLPQAPTTYVHRSGRTGRAGRSGVSLVLVSEEEEYALSDLEDIASIDLIRAGPPSMETVMAAAAQMVPRRLGTVEEQVLPYFTDSAKDILESENALERVSAALALVAGKPAMSIRSLLTGEDGMRTMLIKSTDGSIVTERNAMAIITQLVAGKYDGDVVGKIRMCSDTTQIVFDVSATASDELLAAVDADHAQNGPSGLEFSIVSVLPELRPDLKRIGFQRGKRRERSRRQHSDYSVDEEYGETAVDSGHQQSLSSDDFNAGDSSLFDDSEWSDAVGGTDNNEDRERTSRRSGQRSFDDNDDDREGTGIVWSGKSALRQTRQPPSYNKEAPDSVGRQSGRHSFYDKYDRDSTGIGRNRQRRGDLESTGRRNEWRSFDEANDHDRMTGGQIRQRRGASESSARHSGRRSIDGSSDYDSADVGRSRQRRGELDNTGRRGGRRFIDEDDDHESTGIGWSRQRRGGNYDRDGNSRYTGAGGASRRESGNAGFDDGGTGSYRSGTSSGSNRASSDGYRARRAAIRVGRGGQ